MYVHFMKCCYSANCLTMCTFPQVASVYAAPDIMELNYHAGTACRTVAQSVVTEHAGVRFYGSEIADAITAVLLISISAWMED